MNQVSPITLEGAQKLKYELVRLKEVERKKITQAIEEARSRGDLSENAEYHAAREQQGLNEARIRYLEERLALARIIDVSKLKNTGTVLFGAIVVLLDEKNKKTKYRIVGDDETDSQTGKISVNSPIAKSLIGKKVNDFVKIRVPMGDVEYKILSISFDDE